MMHKTSRRVGNGLHYLQDLVTSNHSFNVWALAVNSGSLGTRILFVGRRDQVILRIGYDLLVLDNVVGIAQEEVLGKEGSDEGNPTCARSDAVSSKYEQLEGSQTYTGSARAST